MKILVLIAIALSALSFNVFADGSKVQLGGYCPVAYVLGDKAVYGDPKFASEYEGKTFYFANEQAKKLFDDEPKKFAVAAQYDGYCATGIAFGKKITTDPAFFSKVDGKVYLFSNADTKSAFDKNPKEMIEKAEKHWKKLSKK